jgi:hypothetical protein
VIEPLEVNGTHVRTIERNKPVSLTAPERETVITFSDDSEIATVQTHHRPIITKLCNNPAAAEVEEVEDLTFDGTAGAVFEIPADLISFRSSRRKLTAEQARAAAANLHSARRAA